MLTTPLVRGRCRIADLIAYVRRGTKDDALFDIIPAVSAQLALEEAAVRALCVYRNIDCYEHVMAHARARLSMFRLATAPRDSAVFRQALTDLADVFDERPYALVRVLTATLEEDDRNVLSEELALLESGFDRPPTQSRDPAPLAAE
jgi:hypothetical protein